MSAFQNRSIKDQALDDAVEIEESDDDKRSNRSEAMKGNKNAERIGELENLIEKVRKRMEAGQVTDSGGTHIFTKKEIAEMKGSIRYTQNQIAELKIEDAEEARRSRSEAMRGNDNAKKEGILD